MNENKQKNSIIIKNSLKRVCKIFRKKRKKEKVV